MKELLLELYSEEIPPQLQISARSQIKQFIENSFKEQNIKYKDLSVYSSPTRLTLFIKDVPEKIKIEAKEIKGPKADSSNQVIQGFLRAKNVSEKELIEKNTDKGKFYFIKKQSKSILVEDLLINIIPKAIGAISWKKSMKWADHNLMWGRPLRSIFAKYNNKILPFKFKHLDATDEVIIEQDLISKNKKIKDFKDYLNFLKINKIIVDQKEREQIIVKKISSFSKSKQYKENFNPKLLEEIVNIVENPNLIHISFNKDFLEIPKEIIISTLEKHQRYLPIFDSRNRLTNYFFVISNKKDEKKINFSRE